MAREVRQYSVTCPAGTALAAAITTNLGMPPRIVRRIVARIPPGPRGEMGFQVAMAATQLVPFDEGQWVVADNEELAWDVNDYPDSGAWQVVMYNTGAYDHSLALRFECDPVQAAQAPAASPDLVDAGTIAASGASLSAGVTPGGTSTLPAPDYTLPPPDLTIPPPDTTTTPAAGNGTSGTGSATPPAAAGAGQVDTYAGTLDQCGYDPPGTFPGTTTPAPAGALGGWCLYRVDPRDQAVPRVWDLNNVALPGVLPTVDVTAIVPPLFYLDPKGLPLTLTTTRGPLWLVRLGGGPLTPWYFTYLGSSPIPGSAEDPTQAIPAGGGGPAAPVVAKPAATAGTTGVRYVGPPVTP